MPMFHVAFSSREMLRKRQIRFLLMAPMTRNVVPSAADFRHLMEVCELDSHGSRRCSTFRAWFRSNIHAIYGLLGPPTKFTTLSPKNVAERA